MMISEASAQHDHDHPHDDEKHDHNEHNHCDHEIKGKILDIVTQEPLPFATISIQENGLGTAADENGEFTLGGICYEEIHLEVRFIGYKSLVHHHDFHHEDPIIFLASDETLLESVIIEESRLNAFQSVAVQQLELSEASLLSNSLGELTEKLSGVSMLKTGSNIAKPMVHGLHSNRVLVINDGLRHAFQAWGEGHAPEIDASHVNEIEVVKGAGTVKYGPEALGGVVLYNSKRPELDHKLSGSIGSSYQTNGRATSGQLHLEQGSHRFAWKANGFGIRQSDLMAPDYNLSNTGKREIERGIPSPTFEPTFNIQNPRHSTQHAILKSDISIFSGEHIFKIKYGAQRNIRKEFDVRRGELNERPVIDLTLWSHTFESEWIQPTKGRWSGNTGFQIFSQNSVNAVGSNPINFVPDYDILNLGAYSIQSMDLGETVLELGLRIDYQTLSARDTIRDVTIYSNEVDFTNATFTLGFSRELSESLSIYSNIGTAWRPPNVSELYSFGYHFSRIQFGMWRYTLNPRISTPLTRVFDEVDRPVNSERSLKWVSGLNYKTDKINSEFVFHINRINDYIFLRPFGITTNVAGTFPYFIFDQTNALFLGSDWDIRYHHSEHFTSEAKVSYVHAIETENDQPFIEIPPLNINYSLEYHKSNWTAGVTVDYMAQQWNAPMVIEPSSFKNGGVEIEPNQIFDFMSAPDDFFLLGFDLKYDHQRFSVNISVDNVLNTSYRSYTDRLRYFSDAPGRNVSFSVLAKF